MECIEVKRSEYGCYEIQGAAEVEDWDGVVIELEPIIKWRQRLMGWDWAMVLEVQDKDDYIRYYFCREQEA